MGLKDGRVYNVDGDSAMKQALHPLESNNAMRAILHAAQEPKVVTVLSCIIPSCLNQVPIFQERYLPSGGGKGVEKDSASLFAPLLAQIFVRKGVFVFEFRDPRVHVRKTCPRLFFL